MILIIAPGRRVEAGPAGKVVNFNLVGRGQSQVEILVKDHKVTASGAGRDVKGAGRCRSSVLIDRKTRMMLVAWTVSFQGSFKART